ncbi:hypothetical protein [Corallibacter sp.]|uniref:hypothetical protein n=1 Tax=Corallibacter sp. TaxID=2038084 RepID=UPI003AB5F679
MKNIKICFIAIMASVFCFSCLVDDEVENTTQNESLARIYGFKDDVTLGNFVEEPGATFEMGVPVHYLGGNNGLPNNAEVKITYELGTIEDLNLTPSEYASTFNLTKDQRIALEDGNAEIRDFVDEAFEGTHFDFVDTVREAVVPANLTFDLIDTNVYNDALNPSKITFYVLHLRTIVTAGNTVIGEQLKSTVVKLQLCRTDLQGSYSVQYNGGNSYTHTITHLGDGNYSIDSMFGWPGAGYTGYFYACAGQLVFTEWAYSNEIIQGVPGYVNASGQIVFEQFGIGGSDGPLYSGWTLVMTLN